MKTKMIKTANGGVYWVLSEDSCSVKIYTASRVKNGSTYTSYCVDYLEAGMRVRKTFSDYGEAKECATTVLTRLINGGASTKSVRPVDLQDMTLAKQELSPGFFAASAIRRFSSPAAYFSKKSSTC